MNTTARKVMRSPKGIFFISLALYVLCQFADLHVAMSGALPWQEALSGLFFNFIFPILIYCRLQRSARPFLKDPRMLPAMHYVAALFGTVQLNTFLTTLVSFSRPWPVLWLILFTATQLLTFTLLFVLARRLFRLVRGRQGG
ncbi:hypothetical protein H3J60_004570 [Salmonella enterica]|nr:hypothetical protein [Salmonella enterica]